MPEPEISGEIKQMEFDEMWHFIGNKKTSFGSSKPLTVAAGEPWPGCWVIVILQHLSDSTKKSNTWKTAFFTPTTGTRLPRCCPKNVILSVNFIPLILSATTAIPVIIWRGLPEKPRLSRRKKEMADLSLRLWCALNNPETFQRFQEIALAIFKWALSKNAWNFGRRMTLSTFCLPNTKYAFENVVITSKTFELIIRVNPW